MAEYFINFAFNHPVSAKCGSKGKSSFYVEGKGKSVVSNGTEPAEIDPVEPGGIIDDWEALDPRDRTERSIVERVFQRILEDVRIFQKNKKPPEEN